MAKEAKTINILFEAEDDVSKVVSKITDRLDALLDSIDSLKDGVNGADKELQKIDETTKDTAKGFGIMDIAIGEVVGNIISGIGEAAIGAVIELASSVIGLSSDFDASSSKIKASLGATAAETEALSGSVQNLFAKGFDVGEATDSIIAVKQNMKGLAENELEAVAQSMLTINKLFGEDMEKSSNAAATLMKEFGLTSQQSLDLMASGFQGGLNTSGDFLDSIGEYSNIFADAGFSAEQFYSIMESGAKGGMLGVDKAADAIKEFSIRMQDGSTTTEDALDDLFAAVGRGDKELEALNAELQFSEHVFSAAEEKVAYWEAQLEASKEESERLSAAIKDTERALDDLSRPNLAGMEEFDDQIFALEMNAKQLQLAMIGLDEDSPQFETTQAALDKVNDQIDALALERDLTFEPQLRAIADAAAYGTEPLMTFDQVMAQIGQKQGELAGLKGSMDGMAATIDSNEDALAKWKAVLAQSSVDIEALNTAIKGTTGPAQEMLNGIRDGSLTVADTFPQIIAMLKEIDDPIKQAEIGVALFGTQWEDMTASGMLNLDMFGTSLDTMTGKMNEMNTAGTTNAQAQQGAMNQILLALKPLGDAFNALIANELVPIIQEYAPQLAEWLGTNLPATINSLKIAIDFLSPVLTALKVLFGVFWEGIKAVTASIDLMVTAFVNVVAAFQGVVSPGNAVKAIFDAMPGPIKMTITIINELVAAANKAAAALLNIKMPDVVGGAKKKLSSLIPKFAGGGYPAPNSLNIVGEEGPEMLVTGNYASAVIPNDRLKSMGGGGGATITIPITIQGSADERTIALLYQRMHDALDTLIQQGAF